MRKPPKISLCSIMHVYIRKPAPPINHCSPNEPKLFFSENPQHQLVTALGVRQVNEPYMYFWYDLAGYWFPYGHPCHISVRCMYVITSGSTWSSKISHIITFFISLHKLQG